jgi:hypothetical protein
VEDLKDAISLEIQNIDVNVLQNVFENVKRRVNLCREQNGGHFEHLL